MRWLIFLVVGTACGVEPAAEQSHELSWRLAGSSCRDLGAARVELEAGGLGLIAHGPCALDAPLQLVLPAGERQLRAQVFDHEDRLLAQGEAPLEASTEVVMRARPGLRGSTWLWPHLGGVAGCEALGVTVYKVQLERPWGVIGQRRMPCDGAGDLLVGSLWPGPWRLGIEALTPAGVVMGAGVFERTVLPGARSPEGEAPFHAQLRPAAGPRGAMDLSYQRHDGSTGDCHAAGVDRLVLDARPVGLQAGIQLTLACGEALPDWNRIMPRPGRLQLLAQAYQDERIYYAGSWSLLFVPGADNPRLILEPQ